MGLDLYVFFLFWITFIGATVGSFLNVLTYRLPRGMNIAFPASHCPNCQSPIRPWHNIPVFGWLILRGRCYDCHEPISIRYPIVEAITGGIWLILSLAVFRWSQNSFSIWFFASVGVGILASVLGGAILVYREKAKIRRETFPKNEKDNKDNK